MLIRKSGPTVSPWSLIAPSVALLSVIVPIAAHAQDALNLGSGSTASTFAGTNINSFIGATAFYSHGYTGTSAIIANIEGGEIWNLQSTLTQVTNYIASPQTSAQFDWHATEVGSVLAGHLPSSTAAATTGIAYNATLWSGAVASSFPTSGNGIAFGEDEFSFSNVTTSYAYYNAMTPQSVGGVIEKANVVNSSWNFNDSTGASFTNRFVDALIYQNGTTFVASAGNNGFGTNSVNGFGAAFNTISVGSVGSDESVPAYSTVSSFSSGGLNDYASNTGATTPAVRVSVDLVAPGEDLNVAYYDGATGSNTGVSQSNRDLFPFIINSAGGSPAGATTDVDQDEQGTSYAAPQVAGGAALLVDAGNEVYASNPNAIDGRVIKAVLMNSADKLAGFSNASTIASGGALVTTQALDQSQGSGELDLNQAYTQYLSGDHGVTLTAGTGHIDSIGWDFNSVALHSSNDYFFNSVLTGGSALTATLDWFMAASDTYVTASPTSTPTSESATADRFDNLYLSLYEVIAPGDDVLVAESEANYITSQQIFFTIPTTGNYMIQVTDNDSQFDDGNAPGNTSYGLAWSDDGSSNSLAPTSDVTASAGAPEPSSVALMLMPTLGLGGIVMRRRFRTMAGRADAKTGLKS